MKRSILTYNVLSLAAAAAWGAGRLPEEVDNLQKGDHMLYCHMNDAGPAWTAYAIELWHMMIKKEGGKPGLFTATSPRLTGPWSEPVDDDYIDFEGNKKCEGVSAFRLPGENTWHIGYIEYSSKPRNYRICQADENMRNFHSPANIKG